MSELPECTGLASANPSRTRLMKANSLLRARRVRIPLWSVVCVLAVPLAYTIWTYRETERLAHQRENTRVVQRDDHRFVRDVAYVKDLRVTTSIWAHTKEIVWWVKIPATDQVFACDWQDGYAGFHKDDGVIVSHIPE